MYEMAWFIDANVKNRPNSPLIGRIRVTFPEVPLATGINILK